MLKQLLSTSINLYLPHKHFGESGPELTPLATHSLSLRGTHNAISYLGIQINFLAMKEMQSQIHDTDNDEDQLDVQQSGHRL